MFTQQHICCVCQDSKSYIVLYAYITYFHFLSFTLTLLSSLANNYLIFITSFYLNLLIWMSKQCWILPLFLKSWSNLQYIKIYGPWPLASFVHSSFVKLVLGASFKMFHECYHMFQNDLETRLLLLVLNRFSDSW